MFTIPEKYIDGQKLEFMLKELSSLFFRVCKFYKNGEYLHKINVKDLSFTMTQYHERKWIKCEVNLECENFNLKFLVTKDGFVYKDCMAFSDGKESTEEDIISLVERTDILQVLRLKITSIGQSFITGNMCNHLELE